MSQEYKCDNFTVHVSNRNRLIYKENERVAFVDGEGTPEGDFIIYADTIGWEDEKPLAPSVEDKNRIIEAVKVALKNWGANYQIC